LSTLFAGHAAAGTERGTSATSSAGADEDGAGCFNSSISCCNSSNLVRTWSWSGTNTGSRQLFGRTAAQFGKYIFHFAPLIFSQFYSVMHTPSTSRRNMTEKEDEESSMYRGSSRVLKTCKTLESDFSEVVLL